MIEFGDRLSALCSTELRAARNDAEKIAYIIAFASKGDAKGTYELLKGAENYLYESAANYKNGLGELIARK